MMWWSNERNASSFAAESLLRMAFNKAALAQALC
jgi:hypothetical protein